jgi:N-acetylmuramate 1-kinase
LNLELIKELSDYFLIDSENLAIRPLKGDASTRKYFRIVLNRHDSKDSHILMDLLNSHEETGKYYKNIQNKLWKNNIPVPVTYYHDKDLSWFLIEDLGDTTLFDYIVINSNFPNKFYHNLVDIIFMIHSIQSESDVKEYSGFSRRFDVEKFLFELNFFKDNFLYGILGLRLSSIEVYSLEKDFEELSKRIVNYPQVLTHRDYHSKNVMVKGEELYIIDFQDARLGPPQYDLVSLLYDSYVNICDEFRDELFKGYIEKYESLNPQFDRHEFTEVYNLCALQRNLKAIGTFASMSLNRKNDYYLQFINVTLDYVKSHFEKIRGLDDLKIILNRYILK